MNSTPMGLEVVVLRLRRDINHRVEADLIEQKINHSLQNVTPAGMEATTLTIQIVITSNSKEITQEEKNVPIVTGYINLRIVEK